MIKAFICHQLNNMTFLCICFYLLWDCIDRIFFGRGKCFLFDIFQQYNFSQYILNF